MVLFPPGASVSLSIKWAESSSLPVSSLGPDKYSLVPLLSLTSPECPSKGSFIQQIFIDFLLFARQGAGVLDTAGERGGASQSGSGDRRVRKYHHKA